MHCMVLVVRKSGRRDRLPTAELLGFPCGSAGKESACNVGSLGLTPGWEDVLQNGKTYPLQYSGLENSMGCKSPAEGLGYPLQYSGLENSMEFIVHVVTKIGRKDRLPTPVFSGFPCGSPGKESSCNVGDLSSIPGLGISPGEGNGYPLQYSH